VSAIAYEPTTEQIAPRDLDAEQGVIAACLVAPQPVEWLAACNDPETLFYPEAHQQIVSAILHLWCESAPVDLNTVCAELRRRGQLEANGGAAYLLACINDLPTYTHAKRYLAVLERCRCSRAMIKLGHALQESGYANLEDPEAEALRLSASLEAAAGNAVDYVRQIEPIGEHMTRDLLPALEKQRAHRETIPGIPTGWRRFDTDHCPGGLMRGRVTVLMAGRKTGKSTLAAHLALTAAQAGHNVGLYSLEMNRSEVGLKLACMHANVPTVKVALGNTRDHEWQSYRISSAAVAKLPIHVCDQRGVDVHRVISWARRLKRERGLDFLLVDYLQLLEPHLDKRQTMERNVSDAARRFVVEAQGLDAHVLLLAQMNQDGHAKWSGQTNDDAHLNWRVVRTDGHGEPDVDGEFFKFHLEQRFGRSGTVPVLYSYAAETGRIDETGIRIGRQPTTDQSDWRDDE